MKGLLRAAKLGGKYLSTSSDAYNCLKENKEYNDEDMGGGGPLFLLSRRQHLWIMCHIVVYRINLVSLASSSSEPGETFP